MFETKQEGLYTIFFAMHARRVCLTLSSVSLYPKRYSIWEKERDDRRADTFPRALADTSEGVRGVWSPIPRRA